MYQLNRRKFLKAIGATGVGAMAVKFGLPDPVAMADLTPSGARILYMYVPQAFIVQGTRMRRPGAHATEAQYAPSISANMGRPDPDGYAFRLADVPEADWSEGLRPMYRHANKFIHFDGVAEALSGHNRPSDGTAVHAWGWHGHTTGGVVRNSNPTRQNLCYDIADFLGGQGLSNRSLDCNVDFHAIGGNLRVDDQYGWLWKGNPGSLSFQSPEGDPIAMWDSLFADLPMSGGDAPSPVAAGQARMLAEVREHYSRALVDAPAEARVRYQAHEEMLANIQARLNSPLARMCSAPAREGWSGLNDRELYDHLVDVWGRIIGMSFACGLSQVATIQFMEPPPSFFDSNTNSLHDRFHEMDERLGTGAMGTEQVRIGTRYTALYMDYMAQLCDVLDAVPEMQGGTLLDRCMVTAQCELATGDHNQGYYQVPHAGGSAIGWNTGQYVHAARTVQSMWSAFTPTTERLYASELAYSRYSVSCMKSFGMPNDNIAGVASMRTQDGQTFSLSGPLDQTLSYAGGPTHIWRAPT